MKTIKPNDMATFFKTQVLENKDVLSVSVFATFKFSTVEPRLLDEQAIWDIAKANLDKEEALDLGTPKHRGEYLIYGSCEVANPVTGIAVQANVGELSKTLIVMGDRYYTRFGITDPKPFTSMPINYKHAFGGGGFPNNPIGKGFVIDGKPLELPNIENPNDPITKKSDHPEPVGFGAYPQMWPQRLKYFGKITNDYIKNDWPGFPSGTNPEYFNTAPADQRLNGFFVGNEKFSLVNMNLNHPSQNSVLPGLRARVFIVQTTSDKQDVFKELITRAETLWLFPNQEVGALLYRSSIEVADEEYSDVSRLYAVWEDLNEPPQSIEYYYNQMMSETNPSNEDVTMPPEVTQSRNDVANGIVKDNNPNNEASVTASEIHPEIIAAMKELEDINSSMLDNLKAKNIDTDQSFLQSMSKSDEIEIENADVNQILKQLEQKNEELVKKFDISPEETARVLAKTSESRKSPPVSDLLERLGIVGGEHQELATNIQKLSDHVQKLELEMPTIDDPNNEAEIILDYTPQPKIPKTAIPEPILSSSQYTREYIIKQYNIDKNLSNLDLSNLDLSKLDLSDANFSGSILEHTNFRESIVNKAVFNNTRIINTDFSDSSLEFAKFEDTFGSGVVFASAKLDSSFFKNADFNNCDFSNVSLSKSVMSETSFEGSSFVNVIASGLNATKCFFVAANFTKANFSKAILLQCDFSNSTITNADFSFINAPELKLGGVIGAHIDFSNSNIVNSRASMDTVIQKSSFKNANMTNSSWEGAKLLESNLIEAILDDSNMSGCEFDKSCLELVVAKNTNFSKASFVDSDLNRINLFKGSLRTANLVGADLRYSNLYGVDFYKAKVGNTKLKGANLKQTLFDVLEIDVDKI